MNMPRTRVARFQTLSLILYGVSLSALLVLLTLSSGLRQYLRMEPPAAPDAVLYYSGHGHIGPRSWFDPTGTATGNVAFDTCVRACVPAYSAPSATPASASNLLTPPASPAPQPLAIGAQALDPLTAADQALKRYALIATLSALEKEKNATRTSDTQPGVLIAAFAAAFSAFVALAGVVSTSFLSWRKERRESHLATYDQEKRTLEIAELRRKLARGDDKSESS